MTRDPGVYQQLVGDDRAADDDRAAAADLTDGVYRHGPREARDVTYGRVYAVVAAAVFILGCVASNHAESHYEKLADPDLMRAASHCDASRSSDAVNAYRRSLAEDDDVDGATFLRHAATWLALSTLGAVAVGFAFLAAFRTRARATVWAMVYFKVATIFALAVVVASGGGDSPGAGVFLALLGCLTAFVFWLWRREIDLVARLLAVASKSLQDNPHVVTAIVGVKLALLTLTVPTFLFVSAAYRNGRVVRDPDAVLQSGKDTCVDENGDRTPCCVWEVDDWASAYVGMTSLFWLWTVMLAFEVRMFTVAGVTAQWYFAPPGTRTFAGTTIGSINNALGPSFGSLALGSLVLTAVRVAREVNENARRNARENGGGVVQILACLVTSCLDCVYALIQHVTKYATIQCAVTGAAFCDAAVAVSRMLTENFLNAYAVWWLPGTLLSAAAFVFSAAYGTCVGLAGYVAWNGADGREDAGAESVILGFVSFILALVAVNFCVTVLLDVVDCVFVCYVMDLDRQRNSRPEVHEIYEEVKAKTAKAAPAEGGSGGSRGSGGFGGAVVQGPGGNVAYGNRRGADDNL